MNPPRTNWAGNITFRARAFHRPSSLEELRELVAGSERVRAAGTGHSFSPAADTPGDLVWTDGLPPVLSIGSGADGPTVTVSGSMSLGRLAQRLHALDLAVPNLPSLPHISVAGACATGTHGSGTGNLAGFVRSMEVVAHDGSLVTLGPQAAVHLGRLGVVTTLTLDLVPAFEVRQYVYEDLPFAAAVDALGSAYSVSLFTDWRRITQVWRKCLAPDAWAAALPVSGPRHPIAGMPAGNCTEQLGVPGPWHERLPHFRLTHTPSTGDELQSEYFVSLADASAAVEALRRLEFRDALQVSELRTVKGDGIWLSPAYGRDSLAIHFTWVSDHDLVEPAIEAVEGALAPFDPRPHPGKLSVLTGRYPHCADFEALAARLDPGGKFS